MDSKADQHDDASTTPTFSEAQTSRTMDPEPEKIAERRVSPTAITRERHLSLKIPFVFERYGTAVLSVGVALGMGLFLENYKVTNVELSLFVLAVALTSWYAGTGPAILLTHSSSGELLMAPLSAVCGISLTA